MNWTLFSCCTVVDEFRLVILDAEASVADGNVSMELKICTHHANVTTCNGNEQQPKKISQEVFFFFNEFIGRSRTHVAIKMSSCYYTHIIK